MGILQPHLPSTSTPGDGVDDLLIHRPVNILEVDFGTRNMPDV